MRLTSLLAIGDAAPAPSIEAVFENTVPSTIDWLRRRGVERVAIYGAGSHTARLLPVWVALAGPPVVAVLTSAPGPVECLDGVPVLSLDCFDPETVQAVILSSQTFERDLAAIAEERWPDLPAVRLYWHPTCSMKSHDREFRVDRSNLNDQRRAV